MTQRELDTAIFERKNYIADKFKDIQSYAQALKTPDDISWKTNVSKIKDTIDEISKVALDVENLEAETPEEEEDSNIDFGAF